MPPDICHRCYHVYLQERKWQQLQTVLTAVMQQNWMHHVCCQTIAFLEDFYRENATTTAAAALAAHTLTDTFIPCYCDTAHQNLLCGYDCGLLVPYIRNTRRREGKEEKLLAGLGRRGGTDPTYVLSLPIHCLLYFSVLLSSRHACPALM